MKSDMVLESDRSLIQRYSDTHDSDAFRELAKRYAGMIYGTCLRITQDHDDAEDVAQECLLALAQRGASIRSSVAGWLHRVASNRSADAIRKACARRTREHKALERESEATDPSWAELSPLVDDAVEKLPDRLRIRVILHYFRGLSSPRF